MRSIIKKQLLKIVEMLIDTQKLVGQAIADGIDITNMLAEQQEVAIGIGNQIEEFEGNKNKTVSFLEQYCDQLWKMSQMTEKVCLTEQKDIITSLLFEIYNQICEIREQCDIFFLPYKASMWDCMESVWKAACEDEDCYPVVMPIPYFDLKDGSVIERHYEGDKFPKYVPIVDYRSIQLEEIKPTIIFIHNAFDSNNTVTSVLPQYYSERLKTVAGRLVYIPYFVTKGTVYMTHRNLPAYENIDFIVTQCPKMIESFADNIPRNKFLPFGNPIVDRIVNLEGEKPSVPDEWKKMLSDVQNFGGRKTVMLNTSISQLLKSKERFLRKLEYVFEITKKREDILLIWRPHPLLLISAKMIGEEFAIQLEEMEKRFVDEKIGILDRNPDVGISVALCDAYIGEKSSSLVHMFGIAGKPRMFLDFQILREDKRKENVKYQVVATCVYGGKKYYLLDDVGWIVVENLITGEKIPFFMIPDRQNILGRAYCGIEVNENQIILFPDNAKGVLVYDLKNKMMRKEFIGENREGESEDLFLPKDSLCVKTIDAGHFLRQNVDYEWKESEEFSIDAFFSYLTTRKKEKVSRYKNSYSFCVANMDGSCGRKILSAVKNSFDEG